MLRRLATILAFSAALVAASPAPTVAAEAPSVRLASVRTDIRGVGVTVAYPEDASSVCLVSSVRELSRRAVDPAAAGSFVVPLTIGVSAVPLRAKTFDASGALIAESSWCTIDPKAFVPGPTTMYLASNQLLTTPSVVSGKTGSGARTMTLYAGSRKVWSGVPTWGRNHGYTLPALHLPYGPSTLRTVASNAWGSGAGTAVPVYQLGVRSAVPRLSYYVMIDRASCDLYVVSKGVVQRAFPVAVGMPQTPTLPGYFVLGDPVSAPSSAWGPFRRQLYRRTSSGTLVGTTRYIHGTNDPDSIGTWASHGCVRMYNSQLREFSGMVARRATVFVR